MPLLHNLWRSSPITDGYTDHFSAFPGDTITFFINGRTNGTRTLNIYDINGNVVDRLNARLIPQQMQPDEPYKNGFGYDPTVSYKVPENLPSGYYLLERKIPFIIKSRDVQGQIVVVYPFNTEHAYNSSGGKSLYGFNSSDFEAANAVSFHRPLHPAVSIFADAFLEWAASSDLPFTYIADPDVDEYHHLDGAEMLVIVGHSEYWSRKARVNFDRFVAEGNDAAVFSGNTMWWQVRYNHDVSQLICYKFNAASDPAPPQLKTTNWSAQGVDYPIEQSIGANFINGGYGTDEDRGWDGYKIASPQSPLLEGTGLAKGDILSCPTLEYDGAPLAGFERTGYPTPDTAALGFHKIELIGFDFGFRTVETVGTFIVFRKTPESGVVVNTATTDWGAERCFNGKDGDKIKQITINILNKVLNDEPVFMK